MKKFLGALFGLALLTTLSDPTEAVAQDKLLKCTIKAVAECNEEFSPDNEYMVAIRGWCYMIRTGICLATPDAESKG